MKHLILISIFYLALISAAFAENSQELSANLAYTQFLKQYVAEGMVDYQGMQSEREVLDTYIQELATVSKDTFDSWSNHEQMAYLINVYNANTLILILNHYPVNSIKDIGGFFKSPWSLEVVPLFNGQVTLDYVEHEILRKKYNEARIHFALVCAAKGCPPLRSEAYVGEKLENQLEDQGMIFLSQKEKNRTDTESKTLYLSPIFKWFKSDFEKGSSSLVKYLDHYFINTKLNETWKIKYTDYDWSLNE